jgi:hypothetical protein
MMIEDDRHIDGLRFGGGTVFRCHGYSSSVLAGQTTALLTLRDILPQNPTA